MEDPILSDSFPSEKFLFLSQRHIFAISLGPEHQQSRLGHAVLQDMSPNTAVS